MEKGFNSISKSLEVQKDNTKKNESAKVLEFESNNNSKISLEYSSSNFEYPESIQNETGILGYERILINNGQIEKYFNENISKEQKNTLSKEILLKISDGRFPSQSFTYSMDAWENKNGNIEKYLQQFKSDKFILQDIFGVSSYFNLKDNGISSAFTRNDQEDTPDNSFFDVFDKKSKKIIGYSDIYTILNKYKDEIKNNEVFIISGNGLNVGELDFWGKIDISNKNDVAFGFDRQDSLFQNYIGKSIDYLRNINNVNKIEPINSTKNNYLNNGYQPRLYPNGLFLELFGLKESGNSISHLAPGGTKGFKFNINIKKDLAIKYGSAFSKNIDDMEKTLDPVYSNTYYGEEQGNYCHRLFQNRYNFEIKKLWDSPIPFLGHKEDVIQNRHLRNSTATYHIPIFINSDQIKQLKWGHSKYATFWTEKGFNFLKIKHADKFPV